MGCQTFCAIGRGLSGESTDGGGGGLVWRSPGEGWLHPPFGRFGACGKQWACLDPGLGLAAGGGVGLGGGAGASTGAVFESLGGVSGWLGGMSGQQSYGGGCGCALSVCVNRVGPGPVGNRRRRVGLALSGLTAGVRPRVDEAVADGGGVGELPGLSGVGRCGRTSRVRWLSGFETVAVRVQSGVLALNRPEGRWASPFCLKVFYGRARHRAWPRW